MMIKKIGADNEMCCFQICHMITAYLYTVYVLCLSLCYDSARFSFSILPTVVLHHYMYFSHKRNPAKIISASAFESISNCSLNHLLYIYMEKQIDA